MQNNDLINIIKSRTSVRSYLLDKPTDEEIFRVLETGLCAPSGKNRQPWRFLVIKDRETIENIAKLTTYSHFIKNAPVLILLYAYQTNDYPIEKDILSIGACLQNILLAATEMGYGTCVIGELFEKKQALNTIINIDYPDLMLLCGITIGRSSNIPKRVTQFEISKFLL